MTKYTETVFQKFIIRLVSVHMAQNILDIFKM